MTPFTYQKPATLADAAIALAGGEAKVMAGGQSLLLSMKTRAARPGGIVSVRLLPEMTRIDETDTGLAIGAATTYATLTKATLQGWWAELAAVAGNLADRSVRNIGTIGGGVCQADPRYDMPTLLTAADATYRLVSAKGERVLQGAAFFRREGGTAIAPDELLTTITLPALDTWTHLVFEKFRYRTFEAAIGLVAIAVKIDGAGKIARIRIVVGAVAGAPAVAAQAMAACEGKSIAELSPEVIATIASHETLPPDEAVTRQQRYQSELTISLVKRALARLRDGDS